MEGELNTPKNIISPQTGDQLIEYQKNSDLSTYQQKQ
jgi:hypothetical protein